MSLPYGFQSREGLPLPERLPGLTERFRLPSDLLVVVSVGQSPVSVRPEACNAQGMPRWMHAMVGHAMPAQVNQRRVIAAARSPACCHHHSGGLMQAGYLHASAWQPACWP